MTGQKIEDTESLSDEVEYDDWWEVDEDVYIHITDEELENFDWEKYDN